ncbi:hypothetical protein GDO81_029175 [Engystomops pustulosus]|uniref:Uncharacterized protein n=1 Tax=Engystomops pustulosus TaxID=76066 RepID=A0AAV6YHZ4_ENGPU|nr:hypothetical protein GDO81_029175 [Engystomops pustulosus]
MLERLPWQRRARPLLMTRSLGRCDVFHDGRRPWRISLSSSSAPFVPPWSVAMARTDPPLPRVCVTSARTKPQPCPGKGTENG